MRADRAYLAGIGTTGVLVASALLLLAVVSTLVAFRGWPGTDVTEDIGNLFVGGSDRPLAVEGPARVAERAAPAAGAVADTPAPGTAAAAASAPPPVPAAAPVRTLTQRTTRGPTNLRLRSEGRLRPNTSFEPPVQDQTRSPLSLLPDTPVGAQVQRVTSGLGEATQGVTDGLGQTVGQLSPPLGATLTDTGRLLAELLRALGQPRPSP